MGKEFTNLTEEDLCDLMCGGPEEELCEDAISRAEECKELMTDINGDTVYAVRMSDIRQLLHVTPKQKTGRWIEERDDYGEITNWHCSNCYDYSGFITTCAWDYCPNCGAKMAESEE